MSLPLDQPNLRFVGLDVHKRQATFCVLDPRGKVLETGTLALNAEYLETFARETLSTDDHVALEATTNCWAVAERLRPWVRRVVVSNPMATKAIAQAKIKTDKVDALVLAQLLRCDYLPSVWQPDPKTQQLRELTGRRIALVQQRTGLRNRIHSILAHRLIETPAMLFDRVGSVWLAELLESDALDEQAIFMIRSDLMLLEHLQTQIDAVEKRFAEEAWQQKRIRLLMTLPGVDMKVALALIAALGDTRRFENPQQAAAYLGLVPSVRQSANTCYHGSITKRGNSHARWMMIQAAHAASRHPGPLGHFFQRLKRRKNHNIAVVALARKMVVIAMHMLRNEEPYRYAVPRSTETKLARLRVRATGQRRRGGHPKGQPRKPAETPGGTRRIKSLPNICRDEGLPTPRKWKAGERKMLQETGCETFAESIQQEQRIPRRGAKREPDFSP